MARPQGETGALQTRGTTQAATVLTNRDPSVTGWVAWTVVDMAATRLQRRLEELVRRPKTVPATETDPGAPRCQKQARHKLRSDPVAGGVEACLQGGHEPGPGASGRSPWSDPEIGKFRDENRLLGDELDRVSSASAESL